MILCLADRLRDRRRRAVDRQLLAHPVPLGRRFVRRLRVGDVVVRERRVAEPVREPVERHDLESRKRRHVGPELREDRFQRRDERRIEHVCCHGRLERSRQLDPAVIRLDVVGAHQGDVDGRVERQRRA
ncbi:MAG: hypothetical protein [Circular genetic element sp.]|nr:MAG: hypothetical protein [Circular genetic element sp.]